MRLRGVSADAPSRVRNIDSMDRAGFTQVRVLRAVTKFHVNGDSAPMCLISISCAQWNHDEKHFTANKLQKFPKIKLVYIMKKSH